MVKMSLHAPEPLFGVMTEELVLCDQYRERTKDDFGLMFVSSQGRRSESCTLARSKRVDVWSLAPSRAPVTG
jgi:hypothetical protein